MAKDKKKDLEKLEFDIKHVINPSCDEILRKMDNFEKKINIKREEKVQISDEKYKNEDILVN